MPMTHHPPDDTVLRYANGTLPEAPAIVVATHLAFCPACRHRMETYEMLGGLDAGERPPGSAVPRRVVGDDGPADALTGADTGAGGGDGRLGHKGNNSSHSNGSSSTAQPTRPELPAGLEWPRALRPYTLPHWRSVASGVKLTTVSFASPDAGQLLVVHGMPGAKLPAHGHDGTEYTCVLTGSYSDSTGIFSAGDLVEANEDHEHQPIVGSDAECVCVIGIEGHLRLHGVARLIQPFLGL